MSNWSEDAPAPAIDAVGPDTFSDISKPSLPEHTRPGWGAMQWMKFSNTVVSSATIALFRALAVPPPPVAPPNAETLPPWYVEEFLRKQKLQGYGKQYGRDTLVLTGAAYLMEGVEGLLKLARGKDDWFNRTLGGVAAAGAVSHVWFPARPHARFGLTSTGAVVGFVSYGAEQSSRVILLDQQHKLETEIMGIPEEKQRTELDPWYLRELLKLKQKHMANELDMKRNQQLGNVNPPATTNGPGGTPPAADAWGNRGFAANGTASGTPPAREAEGGAGAVPEWVARAQAAAAQGSAAPSGRSNDGSGQWEQGGSAEGLEIVDSFVEEGDFHESSSLGEPETGAKPGAAGEKSDGRSSLGAQLWGRPKPASESRQDLQINDRR